MPVQRCRAKGRPGYKWGRTGKCYTYATGDKRGAKRAKNLAQKQGLAIGKGKLE